MKHGNWIICNVIALGQEVNTNKSASTIDVSGQSEAGEFFPSSFTHKFINSFVTVDCIFYFRLSTQFLLHVDRPYSLASIFVFQDSQFNYNKNYKLQIFPKHFTACVLLMLL
jgi:hypothetical protein